MKTTVKNEIDAVCEIYRGHGVPSAVLCRWLSDVDAYIAREILHIDDWSCEYDCSSAPDCELLVSEAPYRRMYLLYLSAMIDFTLKQYNAYANELSEYNRTLDDYRHYIVTKYNPASKSASAREGYYISPYTLAKKHGYKGSEADWIDHLRPLGDIESAVDAILAIQEAYIGGNI